MKKIKYFVTSLFILIFSLFGCVSETFNEPEENCIEPNLIKTKEVGQIFTTVPAAPTLYSDDDIIQGVVTSSNEGGNFFKSLSVMALDGSRGFSISIDEYNLNNIKLEPGRVVFVKLKGLYTTKPSSQNKGLILGFKPATNSTFLSRIPVSEMFNYIFPTCTVMKEEDFVKKVTINQAKVENYINSLIEIDNVQFETEGVTTFGVNPDPILNLFDKNENISDGTNTIVSRTSKFSNFAGSILPQGKGKVRGVLTLFGSTYQVVFRTEKDVNMTNPRVDFAIPIVGNNLVYSTTLNENFESYTAGQTNFPRYVNDAFIGNRYWSVKQFPVGTGNKYIEMSSFQSGASNITYLAIPINFTAANNFSFKSKDGYNKGAALKVYYSTNYTPGGIIDTASFNDITSNFSISTGNTNGYANTFLNSGLYNIPLNVVGNGFVFFEYSGNPTITTTIQLDDIVIN